MQLHEIMSRASYHFQATDTIISVAEAMARNHHSCALICENQVPTGIITERDVVRLFTAVSASKIKKETAVSDVMTTNPICLESDINLVDALNLSRLHKLRHFPVVDDQQKLIGVVTLTDMIKAYLDTLEKKNQLENENQELHLLALEDALTELPNRRAMEMDLRHSDVVSQRRNKGYSLALIDLDNFKNYNDQYGHQAGDAALQHMAQVMKDNIRGSDKAYRYGGEEFLLLMPDTDLDGAYLASERLRKAVQDSAHEQTNGPPGCVTVSIGYADNAGRQWFEVVRDADKALYQAKSSGRNVVCCDFSTTSKLTPS